MPQQKQNFLSYTFSNIEGDINILIALLSQFEFQSFEELEHSMIAYITDTDAKLIDKDSLNHIQSIVSFELDIALVPDVNWNAEWEASFKPIYMDDFCCIRADFHSSDHDCDFDIIINPKMAFGTGHHETTYMMISELRYVELANKSVFDYGCGTGVLAILSEKLGSRNIYAIDYDIESVHNTRENAILNNCKYIEVDHKELRDIKQSSFDIVLANINRHVLLDTVSEVRNLCHETSILFVSGILIQDEFKVVSNYENHGFTLSKKQQRGEWLCLIFEVA